MKTSDLSIKELAAFTSVSTDTIRRTVRKGEIPATRVKTALRLDLQEVLTCMQRNAEARFGGENRGHSEFPASGWGREVM